MRPRRGVSVDPVTGFGGESPAHGLDHEGNNVARHEGEDVLTRGEAGEAWFGMDDEAAEDDVGGCSEEGGRDDERCDLQEEGVVVVLLDMC
jgi:hypothetical protein